AGPASLREAVIDRLPGAEFLGHGTPPDAAPKHLEHGVEQSSVVRRPPAAGPRGPRRQERCDLCPEVIWNCSRCRHLTILQFLAGLQTRFKEEPLCWNKFSPTARPFNNTAMDLLATTAICLPLVSSR